MKKLGSSCDWDRERFTMDEGCSEAVKEVFIKLYEKGYIYRGSRIINWCPVCQTSISDAEVEYEDQEGHFWHIKYPVVGSEGEYVEIATTRPETLLGDSAVAVHPDDERYTHLVGKMLELPLCNRQIPVVADEYVDREFGTGAVKITPAHDPNDFEVGKRHDLPEINILNDDATINKNGGKYEGRHIFIGQRTSVTGVFPDSYGGDTEFQHIIVMNVEKLSQQEKHRKYVLSVDASISHRMKIHWIHGSVLHCGLSQHSDGQRRQKNQITSILQIHW